MGKKSIVTIKILKKKYLLKIYGVKDQEQEYLQNIYLIY